MKTILFVLCFTLVFKFLSFATLFLKEKTTVGNKEFDHQTRTMLRNAITVLESRWI